MTDRCQVCNKTIDFIVDTPIYHDGCGHYACAGACCDDQEAMQSQCRSCSAPSLQTALKTEKRLVVHPPPAHGSGLIGGLLARANSLSINVRNRHETPETSRDVHWLVGLGPTKVSVTMLIEKGFDFNTCVAEGLTIDDFLAGGYSIGDLAQFPEVTTELAGDGITPLGVQALQALRVTATHFKMNPQKLPMERVRQLTGLTNRDLVEKFWMGFHPVHGMQSAQTRGKEPDRSWTIDQLRYMGFETMNSLIDELGMRRLSHWHALRPQDRDVIQLGVTREHIQQLEDDVTVPREPQPIAQQWGGSRRTDYLGSAGPQRVMHISEDGNHVVLPVENPKQEPAPLVKNGVMDLDFDDE